jgi:hypothetical protein
MTAENAATDRLKRPHACVWPHAAGHCESTRHGMRSIRGARSRVRLTMVEHGCLWAAGDRYDAQGD